MHRITPLLAVVLLALAPSCEDESASLFVDLRTDLLPGAEFDTLEVRSAGVPRTISVGAEQDFLSGVRILEESGLAPGTFEMAVVLLRAGNEVLSRSVRVQLAGDLGITVVMTRDCREVICDSAAAETCNAGRCVSVECFEENATACDPNGCATDADCPSTECAIGTCSGSGACLATPIANACGPGAACVPDRDCPLRAYSERDDVSRPPLSDSRATYDSSRQRLVVYGGRERLGQPSAEMWSWDGINAPEVLCDPCAPGPRSSMGLAYDEGRDRIVLFGGRGVDEEAFDDTWEWDGAAWSLTDTPDSPSPRFSFAMAYAPDRAVTVLFGGSVEGGRLPAIEDQDVYEYDGSTWRPITPIETIGPHGGNTGAFVQGVGVVVYGGSSPDTVYADEMHAWDGTTFTPLCTRCTGIPRVDAPLAYVPGDGRLYVFGGYSGRDEIPGTWALDTASGAMTLVDPRFLPKRDSHGVAYDALRDVVVLVGGNGDSCTGNEENDCDEVYEYRLR